MKEALDTTALLCTLSINARHSDSSGGCKAWPTSAFGRMAFFLLKTIFFKVGSGQAASLREAISRQFTWRCAHPCFGTGSVEKWDTMCNYVTPDISILSANRNQHKSNQHSD